MLKNNNQAFLRDISKKMLKQNKLRNRITIVAILLTTFMFTTIFTIGFSDAYNLMQMYLRQQGTRASVYLDRPTDDQIRQIKECKTVEAAGLRIYTGTISDEEESYHYPVFYYDNTEIEKNLTPAIGEITGHFPKTENEIMMPWHVLENIGITNPLLDSTVEVMLDDQKQEFVLCGWYQGYSMINPILVSKCYTDALGLSFDTDGQLCISARNGNSDDTYDEIVDHVVLRDDQGLNIKYDVMQEKNQTRFGILLAVSLISILIMISGYLLIYNVMYISVAKDIRFYGMLKTIGTTSKQIKTLVKKQAMYLAIVGITAGLLLGTLVSFLVVPKFMDIFAVGRNEIFSNKITFHPLIYFFSILFAVITIYLGSKKPAKIASKVSPIEALKYQAGTKRIKGHKKSKKTNEFLMAFRNIFRDKKRARLVLASLFLGTILFLCVNTFIKCLEPENYISRYFYHDYVLYASESDDYFSRDTEYYQDSYRSMFDIAKEMEQIDGMEKVETVRSKRVALPYDKELYQPFLLDYCQLYGDDYEYTSSFFENNEDEETAYGTMLVSVNTDTIRQYNETAKNPIDLKRFEAGEIGILCYMESKEYAQSMTGRSLTVLDQDTGVSRSVEVGFAAGREDVETLVLGSYPVFMGTPDMLVVSDLFMDEFCPDANCNIIIADAKNGQEEKVTPLVQKIESENVIIGGSDIRSVEIKEFKDSMSSLTLGGDAIALILVLIGLINFINVMITSVYTRSNELAILESIGMTKKQIKKMLVCEGFWYGMITIGLILTIGNLMIFGSGKLCMFMADYAVLYYPYQSIIMISLILLLICTVVPCIVFKEITKRTVTERLRAFEV